MSVEFKAQCWEPSGAPGEIRRFELSSDSDFLHLQQVVSRLFPALSEQRYSLFWKDGEEDLVTLSSSEELQLAARCSPSPVRLHIRPQRPTPPTFPRAPAGTRRPFPFSALLTPHCAPKQGRSCGQPRATRAEPPVWLRQWFGLMSGDKRSESKGATASQRDEDSLGLHPSELFEGYLAQMLQPQRDPVEEANKEKGQKPKKGNGSTMKPPAGSPTGNGSPSNAKEKSGLIGEKSSGGVQAEEKVNTPTINLIELGEGFLAALLNQSRPDQAAEEGIQGKEESKQKHDGSKGSEAEEKSTGKKTGTMDSGEMEPPVNDRPSDGTEVLGIGSEKSRASGEGKVKPPPISLLELSEGFLAALLNQIRPDQTAEGGTEERNQQREELKAEDEAEGEESKTKDSSAQPRNDDRDSLAEGKKTAGSRISESLIPEWTIVQPGEGNAAELGRASDERSTASEAGEDLSQRPAPPSYIQASARLYPVIEPSVAVALEQLKAMGFSDEERWLTRLVIAKRGDVSRVLDELDPVRQ